MKIEADLRIAIRSAEKAQPCRDNWTERREAKKKSIADLLKKKPKLAKQIAMADKMGRRADAMLEVSKEPYERIGINRQLNDIFDEEKFIKSGGVLSGPMASRWKADSVIAELLAADKSQQKTILKKYGIKWE